MRLRWPFAILAILAWAFLASTYWYMIETGFNIPGSTFVDFITYPGLLQVGWESFTADASFRYWRMPPNTIHGWWYWDLWYGQEVLVVFPIWVMAIPPTILAAVGFVGMRRRIRPGHCTWCGYRIHDGARCSECGRTAVPRAQ